MKAVLDTLRMSPWLALTVALAVLVYAIAPAQLEVAIWKAMLLSGAAYLGYWIDRNVFPYARPHEVLEYARRAPEAALYAALAMLRRAVIIAAVVIAAALAV